MIGELGWTPRGTVTPEPPSADHPGQVRISTGVTSGTLAAISLGAAGGGLLPSGPFVGEFIFAITEPTSTICRVGFMDEVASPPSDGIYLEKLAGDSAWYAVCRSGGTDSTRVQIGVSTLAAAASAGATNVKLNNAIGLSVGQNLYIAGSGGADNIAITWIGHSGASGHGVDLASGLTHDHAVNDATSGLTTWGSWVRLTIRRHNNEAIDFVIGDDINGNPNARITSQIPTAGLMPVFSIKNDTAADRYMGVDAFQLLMTGLRRGR